MPRTYRSRRIKATTRQHLTDAVTSVAIGAIGAVVLWLITLAIVAQLGVPV